jgi:hypothetical protein
MQRFTDVVSSFEKSKEKPRNPFGERKKKGCIKNCSEHKWTSINIDHKWFTGAVDHFQTLIDPVGRGILMSVLNNRSEAAKKRSLGGKRCVRFSISINNEYDRKLSRLSTSCGMTKSD